jgi:nitrite reductase/ring-hydroxylating ferredoxin subunit
MEAHLQDGWRQDVTARSLCRESDIREGEGRGFVFGSGLEREAVFVIRWKGAFRAYRNVCPHVGTPIDWPENRFFDTSGDYLMCGTHGAVFRPEDGFCIEGPCVGRALITVEIRVEGGAVFLVER